VSEWCQTFVQSKLDPKRFLSEAVQMYCIRMGDSLELDGGP
jgi:hypothetical protein